MLTRCAATRLAHTYQRDLADIQLDQDAANADRDANAIARRAGKTPKSPTLHRDKLAADRRQAAEDIATLDIVLRRVSSDLTNARNQAALDPAWRAHVEDTTATARAAVDQLIPLVEALVSVEAVDLWLTNVGPRFDPRAKVHVSDLIPGLANSGVTRDQAGAVPLADVLATLRDTVL